MGFARFMSSPVGRLVRVIAGGLLVAAGPVLVGGTGGSVLAAAGFLPIISGAGNFCVIGPLFGAPFFGRELTKS